MRYRQPSQLQEDRAVEASLTRQNEFYDNVHFPPEWHAESKRLREEREAIEDSFTPWTEDVYRLADLWRWLRWRKKAPKDPAYFMTHAEEYAEEYAASRLWKGEEV